MGTGKRVSIWSERKTIDIERLILFAVKSGLPDSKVMVAEKQKMIAEKQSN